MYGSQSLLDMLAKLGFAVSYDEVSRYKQFNATVMLCWHMFSITIPLVVRPIHCSVTLAMFQILVVTLMLSRLDYGKLETPY